MIGVAIHVKQLRMNWVSIGVIMKRNLFRPSAVLLAVATRAEHDGKV